jgi:phage shock protein A
MARKTDEARQNFEGASETAASGGKITVFKAPVSADVQEANARCVFIAQAIEEMADGLADLASAIKDVYDKLDVIDRKVS